ncbi:MAG: hypothetical protein ABFD04_06195 [Syntrophomonas sp.]
MEVLLAMSILVSSFIGLLSVHLQSSEWVADSRALTRAAAVSYSLLEVLRSGSLPMDWDLLEKNEWVNLKEAGGNFPLMIMKDQDVYIKLQRMDEGLYQAGVRVEWKRRDAKNRTEMYTQIREAAIKGSFGQQGSGTY